MIYAPHRVVDFNEKTFLAKDRITFVNRMSGDYVYMMNARADCDVEMQQNVACMATLLLYLMNAIYY